MNNTHKVTLRDFARVNNIALERLRVLIKRDKSVPVVAIRKNTSVYSREDLDKWLVINKGRFSEGSKYKASDNGSLFWCSGRDHYVNVSERSNKLGAYCISCERASSKRRIEIKKIPNDKSKSVDPAVKKHHDAMADMAFKREIDSLQDVNAWMLDDRA